MKKNKLLKIISISFIFVICFITLSACSNGNGCGCSKTVNYTITYELNGGKNNSLNPTSYDIESNTITLQEPTKTGYKFSGWNEGNKIETGSTGDKTFTALWIKDIYTITYELGGGDNNSLNPISYDIESNTITLQEPTKTGYIFGGWFDNDELSGVEITSILIGSIGNQKLYAKWNDIFTYNDTTITGLTEIGNTIEYMIIPSGFTTIADNAFMDKTNIKEFVIPKDITSIGDNAFKGCINITSIILNEGLLTIGNNAFMKCNITKLIIPSTVVSIGDSVLGGCVNITELTIPYTGATPTSNESGGAQNFGRIFGTYDYDKDTGNDYFVICSSYNSLGSVINYQIPKCLKEVSFNSNIEEIKSNVFRNCITLETINIPNTVKSISNGAFYGCTNLNNLTLPTSLESIGDTTFENCSSLISVTLESKVVITNLVKASIFEISRKIYVPSSILNSYKLSYTLYKTMFEMIIE